MRERERSARERREKDRERERSSTVIVAGHELLSLIGVPGQNLDEIGDERRDDALQNGTVPTDRVLLVHVRVVVLRHHCDFSFPFLKTIERESKRRPPASPFPLLFRIFHITANIPCKWVVACNWVN